MATVSKNLQRKIMELMITNNGESMDIPKIKEDLTRKKDFVYERDYGEGHLAGVLRVLVSNGELEKVERGVYRRNRATLEQPHAEGVSLEQPLAGEASLEQIWQEAILALDAQYQSLLARMDAVAISSLTPGDLEAVKRLSGLKEELRNLLIRQGVRV